MFPWYFYLMAVVISAVTTALWWKRTFPRLILGMVFFYASTLFMMYLVGRD